MSCKPYHKVLAAVLSISLAALMALTPVQTAFAAEEPAASPAVGEVLSTPAPEEDAGSVLEEEVSVPEEDASQAESSEDESVEDVPPELAPVEPGAILDDGSIYLVSEPLSNEDFVSLGIEMEFDSSLNATFDGSFYSKLTARQKACYNALQNISCEQFYNASSSGVAVNISGITGTKLSGYISGDQFYPTGSGKTTYDKICSDMFVAWAALSFDRPDLIWIQNVIYANFSFSGWGSSATITNAYYQIDKTLGRQASSMRDQTISAARSIATSANRQKDTYSKVKYVHDLLATYSTYQHVSPNAVSERLSHNAYSALIPNDSYNPVCEGYSKAFKMVLDEMRIPCVLIISATHMWNAVKMDDGLWYLVDLTWDDGSDTPCWDYFLVGTSTVCWGEAFSSNASHVEMSPFVGQYMNQPGYFYPKKSTKAYEYLGQDYPPLRYPDVTRDAYYYNAVELVSDLDYFGGSGGKFNPGQNMTRGQFAQVMSKAMNADLKAYKNQKAFVDVDPAAWYGPAAAWAKSAGLMAGTKGKFNPNAAITRQEICVIMANALELQADGNDIVYFNDDNDIASWAKSKVYACRQAKLVAGDSKGNFNPKKFASRAEAAVIFAAFSKLA